MANAVKKQSIYARLTDKEKNTLQKELEKLGMTETDYFTACSHLFIYGENAEEYSLGLNQVISTSNKMRTTLHSILDETYFPTLAMKGPKILLKNEDVVKDILRELNAKCHAIPGFEDFALWVNQYCVMREDRMSQYRADCFTRNLEEEKGEYQDDFCPE
jgi:hypothetical protein